MELATIRKATGMVAGLAAAAISVPLVLGFFGGLHPALDSFSHFRLHLAVMLAALGLVMLAVPTWRLNGAIALLLGVSAHVATVGLPLSGGGAHAQEPAPGATYRLFSMNLRYDNPTPERVLSLIGETRPDIITLVEVSRGWAERLETIAAAYPHRIVCPAHTPIGESAILSRRPFTGSSPACHLGGLLATATVDLGGRPVEIAAVHLGWPWPSPQHRQVGMLAPHLASLGDTAIVAGDFNAAPWSATVRQVAWKGKLTLAGRVGPSWLHRSLSPALLRWVGLPLDHVLTKGAIMAAAPQVLPDAGSDHLAVLMDFMLLPEQAAPGVMHAMVSDTGQ